MTRPTIHWRRLGPTTRRRLALHLCAIAVVLLARLPLAQPAHADTISGPTCILTASGSICPQHFPPPALLDLNQARYAATPAQAASLQVLETQAISDVLTLHDLAPADADAVQSWGRADAEAELFALLLQALNTTAAARTTDQQNAVDWLAAVDQRQAIEAAQDAGLEYVKWAGLDQSTYQSLLNSNASQSTMQTFLSTTPDNYNNPDPTKATGGYCVYRSPAPDSTDYTGYTDVTCTNQCPFICNPPTPSYDQFVKWGEADANYPWLNAPGFGSAETSLAAGLGVGLPLAAAQAASIGSAVAAQLAHQAAYDAVDATLTAANEGSAGGTTAAAEGATAIEEGVAEGVSVSAEGAGAVAVVLAALVTAIIEGITVSNDAKLPSQLATLITSAETTPLDPATLESTSNGASLFSLFIGATLPVPSPCTLDDAASPPGSTILVAGGVTSIVFNGTCLNATDIPAASGTDPQFLVQAKGATTPTTSPTITWKDAASGTTTTARVSETWFIAQANGATVQTLRLAYTDWAGTERTAWLLGNPTDGYNFVTLASSSTAVDPTTCVADGTCSFGPSIEYVGPDGQDYSASVQAYTPPTGAPTFSTMVNGSPVTSSAVEGSPVTFNGNDYEPGAATGPITYTWEFQQTGCGEGFGTGSSSVTVLCQNWSGLAQFGIFPDYTAPVTGTTATYTYPTTGQYLVRLTATDATGKQAVDTFTVAVGDVPPTLALTPACPLATPCDTRSGDVGTAMTLDGTIAHAGAQDSELVLVNWGDGSDEDIASAGPLSILLLHGSPLTLTPNASNTHFTLSDAHTYATGGTYHVTVSVLDQGGGTASQTVVETINNPAPTTSSLALTPPGACSPLVNPLANLIPPAPAVAAIGSSPLVTVTGSGFVPGSTAQWNGTPLATTYVSPCQLTAQVPATDTASATVGALTVVNAAPGGGTSNPQLVYITPDGTLAAGVLATSVGGSATATVGGHSNLIGGVGLPGTPGTLSATASGAGAVAVAQYSNDPLTTTPPSAVNAYFDVTVPAGSSFSSVQVTDCNLGGGSVVYAYDATTQQWTKVSGQSYDAGTGCVTFTLDGGSSPSLSQLSGTAVFGVQNVPPVVTNPGAQSVQYGSPVSVPVSATDAEAADKLTLRASGLPAGLSLHDNGDGTGTISGTVTAPAGVYTATVTANDGYSDSTSATVPFTITPAPLSITANNKSTTYGGSVPSFDAGYSGLVNGDSSGVVSGLTCGATDRQGHPVSSDTPVGTYTITCSGGSAANYSISYVTGTLTINPAPLSITANDQTMLLHGAVPALSASYSGFVNGETASALSTAPTCTTTATSSSSVGSYPITCGGAVDANYAISYQPGTLKVLYKWSGFGQPISDPAAGATSMSVFKAGSTVPVKFQLEDANGAVVQAGSLPTFAVSAPQSCAAGSVDASGTTTTGDTGTTYRWDSTAQQYAYNYHTSSTLAGQCQSITATLDDGTTQSVQVAYK